MRESGLHGLLHPLSSRAIGVKRKSSCSLHLLILAERVAGKRLEVGVLGGEHGDEEEEADEAAAHAKCLRVRPRKTCETGRSQLRVNEWFVSSFID